MVSHNSSSHPDFEILCDTHLSETNNQSPHDHQESSHFRSPLRHLSITQSQNCHLGQVRHRHADPGIHEPNQVSHNQYSGVIQRNGREKRAGHRLARPSITSDTFELLNAVSEVESQTRNLPGDSEASDCAQRILQLPVDTASSHPLSVAAGNIPPLEEQLAKHREGLFEWILAVQFPRDPKSQSDRSFEAEDSAQARKVYFGCNLLPNPSPEASVPAKYLLVVTPLVETEDVLEVFRDPIPEPNMASQTDSGRRTPAKISDYSPVCVANGVSPDSTLCTRGDDSYMGSIRTISPSQPVTRIEDSFEALDILEDQLEAFDNIARFNQFVPTEKPAPIKESAKRADFDITSPAVRFTTPQPPHTFSKLNSASLKVKPATEPRAAALRKMASMQLNARKLKHGNETRSPITTEMSAMKATTKVPPPKQVNKPAKMRTVATYELPGDAVARELKAKKEARIASQRATQPTAASLRRAQSIKIPTRPTFELPGEAISRRKREEHQAQLRTQEEEEKKRREFKARPLPSRPLPMAVPRDTIASRARQGKAVLSENSMHLPAHTKRPCQTINSHTRPALASAINQSHSRSRGTLRDGVSAQASRATSTSTTSRSGTHSPLSAEEVHIQKLRGRGIYRRDNSWFENRQREKQEREALAKLAREEAAERSRQKSREWAARQAKKRMAGVAPRVAAK